MAIIMILEEAVVVILVSVAGFSSIFKSLLTIIIRAACIIDHSWNLAYIIKVIMKPYKYES